jgi:hypothetical protein
MAEEYIKKSSGLMPVGNTQGLLIPSPVEMSVAVASIPEGVGTWKQVQLANGKWISDNAFVVETDGQYSLSIGFQFSAYLTGTTYVAITKNQSTFTGSSQTKWSSSYTGAGSTALAVTLDLKAGDKLRIWIIMPVSATLVDSEVTLTLLQVELPYIIANKGALVSGGAFQFDIDGHGYTENYSTIEMKVGTWINGKPIYKKTVDTGGLPNATSKNVAHNISNIEWVVNSEGQAYSGTTWVSLNRKGAYDDASSVRLAVTHTQIGIATLGDMSQYTQSYVTILYTKTTD